MASGADAGMPERTHVYEAMDARTMCHDVAPAASAGLAAEVGAEATEPEPLGEPLLLSSAVLGGPPPRGARTASGGAGQSDAECERGASEAGGPGLGDVEQDPAGGAAAALEMAVPASIAVHLRPYQRDGVRFLFRYVSPNPDPGAARGSARLERTDALVDVCDRSVIAHCLLLCSW